MQIDDTLVDPHLESIPSFGTFTARGLSGSDSEGLGWHPHGSLHPQFLVLCPLDEVSADLFEALHVAGGQGNPDTVNRAFLGSWLGILVHRLEKGKIIIR